VTDAALEVGAAVTLSRLQARLAELVAAGAAHETGAFAALLEQLRYFAGVQIRNVATVGGCGALRRCSCCSACVARHDCSALVLTERHCVGCATYTVLCAVFFHGLLGFLGVRRAYQRPWRP